MTSRNTRNLAKAVQDALKLWHKNQSTESPLQDMHIFKQELRKADGHVRKATNQVLYTGILMLEKDNEREAKILRLRFLEELHAPKIAKKLNLQKQTIYNEQSKAFSLLADLLQTQEDEERSIHQVNQLTRLELPSSLPLVGVEQHLAQLIPQLACSESPWLNTISGIGGIGKTTLAGTLVRQMIAENLIEEVGWVTARQHVFNPGGTIRSVDAPLLTPETLIEALAEQLLENVPMPDAFSIREVLPILKHHLKTIPHLIVIDNLETLEDIESLVSILRQLANPTKFILTSREHLFTEADIYHFLVPELNKNDAVTLVRQEAKQRNLPQLVEANDATLAPIYQTVGGNPLALRLVVGQTHFQSLDVILNNLQSAKGKKVENLYEFIYRQAWEKLDELTRKAFLAMLLVTDRGATLEQLSKFSGLDEDNLTEALEILITLNLVDWRGNIHEQQYTIHNLTRTFLHEHVLQWS